jgi:hypothetical protein
MALITNGTDVYIFSPLTDHQYLTNANCLRWHTYTRACTHAQFGLKDIVYWNFNSPFPLVLKVHNKDLNPWYDYLVGSYTNIMHNTICNSRILKSTHNILQNSETVIMFRYTPGLWKQVNIVIESVTDMLHIWQTYYLWTNSSLLVLYLEKLGTHPKSKTVWSCNQRLKWFRVPS